MWCRSSQIVEVWIIKWEWWAMTMDSGHNWESNRWRMRDMGQMVDRVEAERVKRGAQRCGRWSVKHGCVVSSRYFSHSFFACFLNLATFTLFIFSQVSLVIISFHPVFVLSFCYSTHDSNKSLWLDDYTLYLILHSHSFILWIEDLIDFFETSDG